MKNYKNVIKRKQSSFFNFDNGNSSDFVKQPAQTCIKPTMK